jgi:hypothetical protein
MSTGGKVQTWKLRESLQVRHDQSTDPQSECFMPSQDVENGLFSLRGSVISADGAIKLDGNSIPWRMLEARA